MFEIANSEVAVNTKKSANKFSGSAMINSQFPAIRNKFTNCTEAVLRFRECGVGGHVNTIYLEYSPGFILTSAVFRSILFFVFAIPFPMAQQAHIPSSVRRVSSPGKSGKSFSGFTCDTFSRFHRMDNNSNGWTFQRYFGRF